MVIDGTKIPTHFHKLSDLPGVKTSWKSWRKPASKWLLSFKWASLSTNKTVPRLIFHTYLEDNNHESCHHRPWDQHTFRICPRKLQAEVPSSDAWRQIPIQQVHHLGWGSRTSSSWLWSCSFIYHSDQRGTVDLLGFAFRSRLASSSCEPGHWPWGNLQLLGQVLPLLQARVLQPSRV